MAEKSPKTPTSLTDAQVFRLFKCAVKDDDTLVDAIIEKLFHTMKDFDANRANGAVELIVDRVAAANPMFRELLNDLMPRRLASRVAA
jgi:hypothetical protein